MNNNYAKLNNIIDKCEYISFDVFDTLLKRNIEKPVDVFELIGKIIKIKNFKDLRIEAEKKARLKANGEILIDDIYNELEGKNIDIIQCKKLEFEIESEVLTKNIDISYIFNSCVLRKKKIFLITDMYLPEEFIKKILLREGFDKYIEIFVSSTYKLKKSDGKLYDFVLKKYNITSRKMLHIGDNFKSDYIVPLCLGINVFYLDKKLIHNCFQYKKNNNSKFIGCVNAIINNYYNHSDNDYYRYGFERFGMLLYGFSLWLIKELNNKKIKKIYFFSRDGKVIKEAFDLCCNSKDFDTYYINVSRRSLRVPMLWLENDFESIINMIFSSKTKTMLSIFDGLGLDINQYQHILMKYKYSKNDIFDIDNIKNDKNLMSLFDDLKEDIINNSKNEYSAILEYLRSIKMEGNCAVVDIGWAAGMQRYLTQIFTSANINTNLFGYYFGITKECFKNTKVVNNMNLNGFLFNCYNNKNDVDKRAGMVGLFETLFMCNEGSVKKYIVNDNYVHIERYENEYNKIDCKFVINYINDIQKGALDFIKHINTIEGLDFENVGSDLFFEGVKKSGISPNNKILNMFEDFYIFDDGEIHMLAKPQKSFLAFLFDLKLLKIDFLNSRWKIGYLKNLLKVPFVSYKFLYDFMKGVFV